MVASTKTLAKNRPTYDTRVPDDMRCRYEYMLPAVSPICVFGCVRMRSVDDTVTLRIPLDVYSLQHCFLGGLSFMISRDDNSSVCIETV